MNIKEANKLISEYMYPDWVHPEDTSEHITPLLEAVGGSYAVLARLLDEDYESLNFHNSWSSLMKVVIKITNFKFVGDLNGDHAYFRTFGMKTKGTDLYMVRINRFKVHTAEEFIDAAYAAVVEFINWYNENKNDDGQVSS